MQSDEVAASCGILSSALDCAKMLRRERIRLSRLVPPSKWGLLYACAGANADMQRDVR